MKNSMQKFIAMMLSILLVFGQIATPVLAATSDDVTLNGNVMPLAVPGSAGILDFDPYSDYVESEIVLTNPDTGAPYPDDHQFSNGDELRFMVRFELDASNAWYVDKTKQKECKYLIREAYRQGYTGPDDNAQQTTLPQIDENTVFTIPFKGLQYLAQANNLPWSEAQKQPARIGATNNVAFYWWLDRATNKLCLTFTKEALDGSKGHDTLNNLFINVKGVLDTSQLSGQNSADFTVGNVNFQLPLAASYNISKNSQMVYNKNTGNYDINYTVRLNVDREVDLSATQLNILDTVFDNSIIGKPSNVSVTTNSGDDVGVTVTNVDNKNTKFQFTSNDQKLAKGEYVITYTSPVTQSFDSLFANNGEGYRNLGGDQRKNAVQVYQGNEPTNTRADSYLNWVSPGEETRIHKSAVHNGNTLNYNNIYRETVNGQTVYYVNFYLEAKIKNEASSITLTDDGGQWLSHVNEQPQLLYIQKGLDEGYDPNTMGTAQGVSVSTADNGSVRTYTLNGSPIPAGVYRLNYRMQLKPEAVEQLLSGASMPNIVNNATFATLDNQSVPHRNTQTNVSIPNRYASSKSYHVTTLEDGTKLVQWTLNFRWNFFQDEGLSNVVDTLTNGTYYIAEGYPFVINNNYQQRASITDAANAGNIGVVFNEDKTSFTFTLGNTGNNEERTDAFYSITYYTKVEPDAEGNYPSHTNSYDVNYSFNGTIGGDEGNVTVNFDDPSDPDNPNNPDDPQNPGENVIEVSPMKKHQSSTFDKSSQTVVTTWEIEVDLSNLPLERMTSFQISDVIPDHMKNYMNITDVSVYGRGHDWNVAANFTENTDYTVTKTSDDLWTVTMSETALREGCENVRWLCVAVTTSSSLINPSQEDQNYQNFCRLDYTYSPVNPEAEDFVVSKTSDAWCNYKRLLSKKEVSAYSDFYNSTTNQYAMNQDGKNDIVWQLSLRDTAFVNRGTATTVTITDTLPVTGAGVPIFQLIEPSVRVRSTSVYDGSASIYIENYTLQSDGNCFTLTFDVPADWRSDTVYVLYCCDFTKEFMSTITGDTHLNNATNNATVEWDGGSQQLKANLSLNIPDKRLNKTGSVSNDHSMVNYTIKINEYGQDLDATSDTLVLTDRLNSSSVVYAQASFVLKDSSGNTLTRSGYASANTYRLKFSEDGKSFELEVPDETSLTLIYFADPTIQIGQQTGNIENVVSLQNISRHFTVNSFKVDMSSAGASTALPKGACGVMVYKNDGETDLPLDDAVFTIYKVDPQLQETETTKTGTTVDGRTTFTFLADEEGFGFDQVYCLRETEAPEGYQKNDNAWYFYFVQRDADGVVMEPSASVQATIDALTAAGKTVYVNPELETYVYTAVNMPRTQITAVFTFTKVDENGAHLDGASFTLTDADQQPVTVKAGTTTGVFTYENLLPGTYTLTENTAPAGYAKPADATWTVVVDENGVVSVTGAGFDATNSTITNTLITGDFTFTKVDENGVALDGATFTLTDANQQPVTAKAGTTTGVFTYENLLPGTYTLSENAAPAGYAKPANTTWTVTVDATGAVTVTGADFNTTNNTITNTLITGDFTFIKVDETGAPLDGAIFTLTDADQQPVTAKVGTTTGVFIYENLLPGTYTLTENAAPAGYAKPANTTWTVTVDATGVVTVSGADYNTTNNTITNTLITGDFTFIKVDETGAPLDGATFTLTDANQQPVTAKAGTATGVFIYENLLPGTYTLTETAAPAGYAKPANTTWTVTVDATGAVTVTGADFNTTNNTITNTLITGDFTFIKVDETGTPLDGATFTLTDANQQPVTAKAGTTTGVFTYENLLPGTYTLTEITAPAGYAKPVNTTWTVTVDATGAVTVTGADYNTTNNTITNTLITGDFTFIKVDETGTPLDGATFTLTDADQQPVTAKAGTTTGVFTYENLLPGTYTLTEITAPAGYALPANTTWTVVVDATGAVTVTGADFNTTDNTITNTLITGDFTFTKVDETGTPLDGATFTLTDANQQPVTAKVGTATGVFTYENLLPGTYTLTEIAAPAGYAKPANATWTVVVDATGAVTVTGDGYNTTNNTITNTLITGDFTFTKVDETGTPLDGATFTLTDANQQPVTAKAGTTTGVFIYENLLPGTYTLTETAAPAGYAKPANTTWTIVVDATGAVTVTGADFNTTDNTITNTFITGDFTFIKVDETGTPLDGATFTLTDANQQPVTAKAGTATGVFTYENLLPGTYTLTEITAPAGYALPANTTWTVIVDAVGAVTVMGADFNATDKTITNKKITGDFTFTKVDETGVPLSGATFTLMDADQRTVSAKEGTANGVYIYEDLLPGVYTLIEAAAPTGYELPANTTWTVTVNEAGTVTVTGADFNTENNTIVNTKIQGTFSFTKVDENGIALDGASFTLVDAENRAISAAEDTVIGVFTYENLVPGTYILTETAAPAGYMMPTNTTWIVVVDADGSVTVNGDDFDSNSNTITNTMIAGDLTFCKVDENGDALDGATFTLVDAEGNSITAVDGTAPGVFTYENLRPGTYTLTETAAPAGYALPANTTWIVTVDDNCGVAVAGENFNTTNNTIINTLITGDFTFTKVDETGTALDGATFTLIDANQQLISAKTGTTTGVFIYEDLLPGTYTLTETSAPAGYALPANTTWTVIVDADGEISVVGADFDVESNTITNTLITGDFTFTKVDETGTPLDGATFTLTDANQQPVTAKVGTTTGVFTYENLLPGTYTLTEITAPAGYAKPANTTWTVTVDATGAVTVTGDGYNTTNNTITNTLITGDFTFTKVDETGTPLDGATFTLTDANQQPVTAKAGTTTGVFTYENLLPGTYTLTETAAPAGYAKPANTTWTVVVDATGVVTVSGADFNTTDNTITNTLITGDFTFTKVDETGTPLDGATFTLTDANQQPVTAKAGTTTGVFTYENLLPGTYTLTETAAPAGYAKPANTTWTVTVDATGTVTVAGADFNTTNNTITNTLITGEFTFTKVDETGAPLDGATFTLTDANQQPVTAKAGTATGVFTYENLLPGTYILTETAAPAGYAKPANTTWTVTVDATGAVTVTGADYNTTDNTITNKLITGDFTFTKVDETGAPLDGATFTLTDANQQPVTAKVGTTTGMFTYENLLPGTYTLTETAAPAGYALPTNTTWTVTVDATGAVTVTGADYNTTNNTITNTLITGDFTFTKVDETGAPLDGATFTLTNAEGTAITAAEATTTGVFTYENLLPGTYTLTETAAPAGYAKPANTTWTVTVDATGAVTVTGADYNTTNNTITNTLITADFTFTKVDENGTALGGATFTLTDAQGNTIRAAANTAVGVFTYEDLLPGTYILTETAAPVGYHLPANTRWQVTVALDGTISVIGADFNTATNTIINKQIRRMFTFTKVDAVDASLKLAGARFELSGNGYRAQADSDRYGKVVFTDLLPGEYTLKEVSAPSGYVRCPQTWKLTVHLDGTFDVDGRTNVRDLYQIANSRSGYIPQTGAITWHKDVVLTLGYVLFMLGAVMMLCRRRRDRHEK